MDHRGNGNVVANGSFNKRQTVTEGTTKKKMKKWSLGGLFKRRRAKSSDTDSSTEVEVDCKKKGFLALRPSNRHKSASHKVVGKFETIIIPRNEPANFKNGCMLNSIENYDASPNMIKRRPEVVMSNGVYPNQVISAQSRNSLDFSRGSNGSMENTSRRNGKQRIKAKVEAMRDRLGDSSSSDEYCGSSKTSNSSSLQNEGRDGGSLSRKSRAARTDRYIRRHFRDNNPVHYHSISDPRLANGYKTTPAGNPPNRWIARVVYQHSHDYPRTQSAASSPMSSPMSRSRSFECSSLPAKRSDLLNSSVTSVSYVPYENQSYTQFMSPQSCESLPKVAPPPPPRNPHRRFIPLVVGGRPSSYAFDTNTKSTDVIAYMNQSGPFGYSVQKNLVNGDKLQQKSRSDFELQNDRPRQGYAPSKYCANRSPRSRNPIQLVRNEDFSDDICPVPNNLNTVHINPMLVPKNGLHGTTDTSLNKANEIGIPVSNPPVTYSHLINSTSQNTTGIPERSLRGRPLSIVSEKSDNEFLTEGSTSEAQKSFSQREKQKPKNLEEALVELEEIYNSLQLSDEDLLDRAERRDLQSAIRMNPNFSRHSWNDLDESSEDAVDNRKVISVECLYSPEDRYMFSPRLPTKRRSVKPDTVADDMAYRKLNKRNKQDPKSNPNLVSQSGSFLLVSPALSPPPLVDVHPIITQINKEPDITLDDVVFRNIRHTNNTLKISDPQLPFGIPLGPVSPAPNSDYLHATPSEKYRSTFNPMRTPDVVKDDLAFRNLRKDVQSRPDVTKQYYIVPSCADSKKRRAIRSLSANIVSMVGKDGNYSSENEDSLVDVNCNDLGKGGRSASFNNLPDVLEDYQNRRRVLMKNCEECLDHDVVTNDSKSSNRSVSQIAEEARMLSKDLRKKLRELDAIPIANCLDEYVDERALDVHKDVFRKQVALHKPIILSQFKIDDKANKCGMILGHSNADMNDVDREQTNVSKKGFFLKDSRQNFNPNGIQTVCPPYKGELNKKSNYSFAENDATAQYAKYENSSSGVSSTCNTPDLSCMCESDFSSITCNAFSLDPPALSAPSHDDELGRGVTNKFSNGNVPQNVREPISNGSVKSKTLQSIRKNASAGEFDGRKCSRLEITLSPPQPSGGADIKRRWSSIETKDAAVMTEELSVPGGNENCVRMRRMSGDTPQARVSRYKEERRKQLAGQFANLIPVRHHDSASSSSSTTSETNFRKTPIRIYKVTEGDVRKTKIPSSVSTRSSNRIRYKEDTLPISTDSKKQTNGSITSDSISTNSSKNGNIRDKSAKRKSFLNRSVDNSSERTPSNNRSHNRHGQLNISTHDKNGDQDCDTRNIISSSLPVPVTSTTASSLSSLSSQKPCLNSSPFGKSDRNDPLLKLESTYNDSAQRNSSSHNPPIDLTGAISPEASDDGIVDHVFTNSTPIGSCAVPRIFELREKNVYNPAVDSLNITYDKTSSDFRLHDNDLMRFEDESLSGNSDRKSDVMNSGNITSYVDANAENNRLNSFRMRDRTGASRGSSVNEETLSQKNSLLEIIQTFSEKNTAAQKTAENNTDESHNSKIETSDLSMKRSVFAMSKLNGTRNDNFTCPTYPRPPSPQNNLSLGIIEEDDVTIKPSILKKKFDERSVNVDLSRPNSILKRKTADELNNTHSYQGIKTFRQGILKKHSSLDEEEIARRSCSPDVDLKYQEFKPILKGQRRSSLEEIVRVRSPELHSILKRSKQPSEEISDSSSSSPHHGILKRKISITNGYYDRKSFDSDIISDTESAVKPILKNKQHSLEIATPENNMLETRKPILKKKFFEAELDEDKPKKPILKSFRKSLDEEKIPSNRARFVDWQSGEDRSIKPILKKKDGYRMDTRSVKSDDDTADGSRRISERIKRNSLPGFGVLGRRSTSPTEFKNRQASNVDKVTESRVYTDKEERTKLGTATENNGYIKMHLINNQDVVSHSRTYRTNEEKFCAMESKSNEHLKGETGSSNSDCSGTNTAEKNSDKEAGSDCSDEKEMISKLKRSNSVSAKASLFQQLAKESKKALEDGLLKKRNETSNASRRKLKVKCADLNSRFSTQPVTWDEVAEAKKQNSESLSKITDIRNEILEIAENNVANGYRYLPISERVKLLTKKFEEADSSVTCSSIKRSGSRFNTQPVTNQELRVAKIGFFGSTASEMELDSTLTTNTENANERKSALKNTSSTLKCKTERVLPTKTSGQRKGSAEKVSEPSSQSEGDTSSSGGREIQSIISGKHYPIGKSQESKNRAGKMNSLITGGTDVVDECPVINGNKSIKQRLAALQQSGQADWKKRVTKKEVSPIIKVNETQELLKKELQNGFRCKVTGGIRMDEKNDGTLADRLEKLETASQTWKKRIEPTDVVQFSVAGKIASNLPSTPTTPKLLPTGSPLSERKKRGPCPSRFRSFREQKKENQSEAVALDKSKSDVAINRGNLLPPTGGSEVLVGDVKSCKAEANTVVTVPQIFDDNFTTFFGKIDSVFAGENSGGQDTDFSFIKSDTPRLVPVHKKVRAQRKHATTGNPLKNMATKIEIKNEYREVKKNAADREVKKMNIEKFSKNSSLAVEALAGLASKEDFSSVQLKKAVPLSSAMLPYKPLMLLHVKGRRHVQTRLVEPISDSVNSGDSYVLVTPNEVYHYIGQYANVIERSRGAEIAQHIVASHDLGCAGASVVITITEDSAKVNSRAAQQFWKLLNVKPEFASSTKATATGHPDEDEIYESSLLSTNMIYEAHEDELVPMEKYWASIPKIHMLDPNKVLVFDFGTELYVWMGKNVDMKLRKSSVKLAKELWENGFNYEECDLCPINSAKAIGNRDASSVPDKKRGNQRPDWCLFAKVTQHMETVLFREKFLDWPDFTRVIRTKEQEGNSEKQTDNNFEMSPFSAKEMLEMKMNEPDFILENSHLGRGTQYFDEERRLFYKITTSNVKMWHVEEFESELMASESMGQFYSTDSYVIKWVYSISYTGRELTGQPSKHTTLGRDRCVFFYWQGKNASLNEQGAAALLTVELDEEKGIQLRISQGYEPPAFFNLFEGRAIIYKGKKSTKDKDWRLFICRNEVETEAVLLEVSCNIRQLRSRASFILINITTGTTFVWNGCKVTKTASKLCKSVVDKLTAKPPPELGLGSNVTPSVTEINEGNEPKEFFNGLGGSSKKLYVSLLDDKEVYDSTPLLFSFSSSSGTFSVTPIWSPCRSTKEITGYPFLQEDFYLANQPALFMLDSGKEIWLWQGWWPERENTDNEISEDSAQNVDKDRGSASIRWQAERRAAMQTVLDYWKLKYVGKPVKAFLVWAGLEPIQFTNLFPDWSDRDDVAEMNILDGKKPGEVLDVEQELERLTQSTYPIEQLLQRPLPEGVDPTKLELYLSASHFKELMQMTKEEFSSLPNWKQTNLKKNAGLF